VDAQALGQLLLGERVQSAGAVFQEVALLFEQGLRDQGDGGVAVSQVVYELPGGRR